MNVAYINPFLLAAENVFGTMIHLPLKLGKPSLKAAGEPLHKLFKIAATLSLSGAARGVVVLHFTEPVALALASGLCGSPVRKVDADCRDALGEIANMIAGNAKKDLPGGQSSLSTPRIVRATEVTYPPNVPVIVIPFDTSAGRFIVEVALQTPRESPPPSGAQASPAPDPPATAAAPASEAPAPEAKASAPEAKAAA